MNNNNPLLEDTINLKKKNIIRREINMNNMITMIMIKRKAMKSIMRMNKITRGHTIEVMIYCYSLPISLYT